MRGMKPMETAKKRTSFLKKRSKRLLFSSRVAGEWLFLKQPAGGTKNALALVLEEQASAWSISGMIGRTVKAADTWSLRHRIALTTNAAPFGRLGGRGIS
jgi:hypothetical protein